MISSVPSGVGRDPTAALAALEVAPQPLAAAQPPGLRLAPARPVLAAAAERAHDGGEEAGAAGQQEAQRDGLRLLREARPPASTSKATSAKAGGALAFLDDPRLSTEEKLFRFMMYVTEKYDRDIEQKMKEARRAAGAPAAGRDDEHQEDVVEPVLQDRGRPEDGLPGRGHRARDAEQQEPAVARQVHLRAGARRGRHRARDARRWRPCLAKAGPQLAGVAFDLRQGARRRAASTDATAIERRAARRSGASGGSPRSTARKVMELQYAMDKQKEMFSLVSNILRSDARHEDGRRPEHPVMRSADMGHAETTQEPAARTGARAHARRGAGHDARAGRRHRGARRGGAARRGAPRWRGRCSRGWW